jgi:uncharacterized membrane protein
MELASQLKYITNIYSLFAFISLIALVYFAKLLLNPTTEKRGKNGTGETSIPLVGDLTGKQRYNLLILGIILTFVLTISMVYLAANHANKQQDRDNNKPNNTITECTILKKEKKDLLIKQETINQLLRKNRTDTLIADSISTYATIQGLNSKILKSCE